MNKKLLSLLLSFCLLLSMFVDISGFNGKNLAYAQENNMKDDAVHVHNTAYLDADWIFTPHTDQFIIDHVNQLKKYSIEYQFNNIGGIHDDGTIDTNQVDFGHWIKVSRETDPYQKIIAWIN